MTPRKPFAQHSARWQREALRDGIDPKRWNRWLKLSPRTKAKVDVKRYAKGESVRDVQLSGLRKQVVEKMARRTNARYTSVVANVRLMKANDLRWTIKASDNQIADRARDVAFERDVAGKARNPWWYR